MALNTTGGAPLGGGGRPSLRDLQGRASSVLIKPDELAPNPVRDVMDAASNIYPQQFSPPPKMGGLIEASQQPVVNSFEDVARATGSATVPRYVHETDLSGNPLLDDQGQKRYKELTPQDYAATQAQQLADSDTISQAVNTFADVYADQKGATTDVLDFALEKAGSVKGARALQKLASAFGDPIRKDRMAESSQIDLNLIKVDAYASLFDDNDTQTLVNTDEGPMSTGIAALYESYGIEGVQERMPDLPAISLLYGLAKHKQAIQTPVEAARNTQGGKLVPLNIEGKKIPEGQYLSEFIDGIDHHVANALENAKIPMEPKARKAMSRGVAIDATRKGDFLYYHDPNTGRVVLLTAPTTRAMAKGLESFIEITTGDSKRNYPSDTPAPAGTSFDKGVPQTSANSPKDRSLGLVTKVADDTKSLLGTMATGFEAKDIKRQEIFVTQALEDSWLVKDEEGNVMWSNHPFASRLDIAEVNFESAKLKANPPEMYNPKDASQKTAYEQAQHQQAVQVIGDAIAKHQYDIADAKKLSGKMRYMEWQHAIANQRFFPNSAGTDYMGSKRGTREMISLKNKDYANAISLFGDPKTKDYSEVERLKEKGISILKMPGEKQNEALKKLPNQELGAIGTMLDAVINYYTVVSQDVANITKYSPPEVLAMYTPDIGNRLASLGAQYNAWLNDPSMNDANKNIIAYLAKMEPGESMGNANLWDDMFNLQQKANNPLEAKERVPLTHLSFDDGNQNGIFLQAIFFGARQTAVRLGTFNPTLADMREYSASIIVSKLLDSLKDFPEKAEAWRRFVEDGQAKLGTDTFAKRLFKNPLMQTSYSKDASMYLNHVLDFLEAVPDQTVELGRATGMTLDEMGYHLNGALEMTLREVVSNDNTNMLKGIGRYTSILNTSVFVPGLVGDTMVLTAPGVLPVSRLNGEADVVFGREENGEKVLFKRKHYNTNTLLQPSGEDSATVTETRRGLDPNATKGMTKFWNRRTQQYDYFDNALGTSQQRLFVVMPIQSADGDLVKLTTLLANKDTKVPYGILWVHDSIISTPGASLIYRNTYNNISIPKAVPEIAKFGEKIGAVVDKAEAREFARVDKMDAVGIGDSGDYPSLGAYFDELHGKAEGGNYETHYKARWGAEKWPKAQARMREVLTEAKKHGWKPPGYFSELAYVDGEIRAELAVRPDQFKELAILAKKGLNMAGLNNKFDSWRRNFASTVNHGFKSFIALTERGGVGQMTYGGGSYVDPKKFDYPSKPAKKEKPVEVQPEAKSSFDWANMADPDELFGGSAEASFNDSAITGIDSLEKYRKALDQYNYRSRFSDDYKVWKQGVQQKKELMEAAKTFDPDLKLFKKRIPDAS